MNNRGKQLIWRGLAALTAAMLVFSLAAVPLVNKFRTDIDKFLGTSSTVLVSDESDEALNLYTWKTDYTSTREHSSQEILTGTNATLLHSPL